MDRSSLKVAQTMRSGQSFGFKLSFGKRICHKGMMYSNLQLTAESNYVILYPQTQIIHIRCRVYIGANHSECSSHALAIP